jgi:hypothetical protein
MKRIVLLLFIGLMLVACGSSTSSDTLVAVPDAPAQPDPTQPAAEAENKASTDSETDPAVGEIPGFPAATVEEASIVRDRDWVKGTDDPLVAIIEYGDFQ